MKKEPHSAPRSVRNGRFVLGSGKGEKIGAVEGMKLSPRMATVLRESRVRGMSGDEQRALIKEQVNRRK